MAPRNWGLLHATTGDVTNYNDRTSGVLGLRCTSFQRLSSLLVATLPQAQVLTSGLVRQEKRFQHTGSPFDVCMGCYTPRTIRSVYSFGRQRALISLTYDLVTASGFVNPTGGSARWRDPYRASP